MYISKILKTNRTAFYAGTLAVMVLILSTKGITDENVVSLNGDMPRFMMNGVYFYDLLKDVPVSNPLEHAYLYFAQYPALSLGHHPILLGVTEVPFYAAFGISVFSARLCVVFFTVIGVIALFFLVRLNYGDEVAFLASALFATTPFVVKYSRIVMPEIQALALIIVSTYFFCRYIKYDNKYLAAATIFFFVLGLYAKHLAVFIFPAFVLTYMIEKGPRQIFRKEIIIFCIIGVILTLPLIFMTLKFSQSNVQWAAQSSLQSKLSLANIGFYPTVLYRQHVTVPILIFSFIGIMISAVRKDWRIVLYVLWILCIYFLLAGMGISKEARHGMYWIPAFCVCAAVVVSLVKNRWMKTAAAVILALIVLYQFGISYNMKPEYASGYEELAKYVAEKNKGDSVLYGSVKDSGYFIFFARKHDKDRNLIILRTDKILATSKLDKIVSDKIKSEKDIYNILDNFGVRYVVLDNDAFGSSALEIFNQEVKSSPKFKLVKGTQIQSDSKIFDDTPLQIYEYSDYQPARYEKLIDMDIPLAGDSINIPIEKLFQKRSLNR
jgi:hypothetical protein